MDFFQSPYYNINKLLLYYLGLWPLQKPIERFIFRSTTIILVGSIILPKMIKFVEYFGDIDGMIQCIPVLGLHALSAGNFFTCTINENKFKMLTCRIREDWITQSTNFSETHLKRYATRARLLTIGYTIYLYSTLYLYLLAPTLPIFLDIVIPLNQSRDRLPVYETEYFIDQDKYYFVFLLHAYITMPVSLGIIIAFDTMFAVYVHHACGIFATLGAQLESIGVERNNVKSEKMENRMEERDEDYEKIVSCIKMHRRAAEFAKLIEYSTSWTFLFVLGIFMLMVTVTGFMTVTNLDNLEEALRFGTFTAAEILHVYYICWQGQLLTDHSASIFVHAYNVEWYELSPPAKKLLILIMMRSSVPCKITAGKVWDLSLINFTTVLKTSMSYFTVLLSMQ